MVKRYEGKRVVGVNRRMARGNIGTALALLEKKRDFVIRQAANPDWEEVVRLYAGLLPRGDDAKGLIRGLWTINRPLALRVTTEVRIPPAEIIQPMIAQEAPTQIRRGGTFGTINTRVRSSAAHQRESDRR